EIDSGWYPSKEGGNWRQVHTGLETPPSQNRDKFKFQKRASAMSLAAEQGSQCEESAAWLTKINEARNDDSSCSLQRRTRKIGSP
ncbi:MAG: hypothetical protein ABSG00_13510, partial [Terracidiphilus sp.]